MAGGILALLDDVAALLDDAAMMSKVAAKKTAGLLSDDLAVNAEKATGFHASRELPVIWAITKGSFLNKLIILPVAFLLSAFLPWLIVPILLAGGAYLSYEGAEKVYEWFSRPPKEKPTAEKLSDKSDILLSESAKIKSAVRTDFILSIEIIVITLEAVVDQSFLIQAMVVSLIAVLATIGVYGVVALLVRMDDAGFYLIERSKHREGMSKSLIRSTGEILVNSLPIVIRVLGILGTIAMLLVGGGMFVHNIEVIHHMMSVIPALLANLVAGLIVGLFLVFILHIFKVKYGQPA